MTTSIEYIGISNGETYNLYAVNLPKNLGLCDIEGYNCPQWCLFEEIKPLSNNN